VRTGSKALLPVIIRNTANLLHHAWQNHTECPGVDFYVKAACRAAARVMYNHEVSQYVSENEPTGPTDLYKKGRDTPLEVHAHSLAAYVGHRRRLAGFLPKSDINAGSFFFHGTPLIAAASSGAFEDSQDLISSGADIEARSP
jgi:hypothetical protein